MHYIVYKITNLKNLKSYIGCHETKDVNDLYMGSGKLIKLAIKKYGLNNFKKEILVNCDSRELMLTKEIELIDKLKPEYNLHKGGSGGWGYINETGKSVRFYGTKEASRRAQEKMKELRKDPEFQKNISKKLSLTLNEGLKSGRIKPAFLGKKHSEEFKDKIGKINSIKQSGNGNSNYGKKWIHNKEIRKSISVKLSEIDKYISYGWEIGRKIKW